jgi:hypothetical protein
MTCKPTHQASIVTVHRSSGSQYRPFFAFSKKCSGLFQRLNCDAAFVPPNSDCATAIRCSICGGGGIRCNELHLLTALGP